MISVNDNFLKLPGSYLFTEIAHRVAAYKEANPHAQVIKMGIGDVTLPLPAACIMEMQKAICEMAHKESFHGYGPEQGYEFLRQAIADDYKQNGVSLAVDEIFVSDGSKSDCGNIGDIFSNSCKVALTDPVYPVYVDTNAMAGRAGDLLPNGQWSNLVYMPVTAANDFVPELPKEPVDLIYLCFPNNPTGEKPVEGLCRLCAQNRCSHPLRCRLRGFYYREGCSALYFRNTRGARLRYRIPLFL